MEYANSNFLKVFLFLFSVGFVSAVILVNGGGTVFSSTNESLVARYNFSVNNTQASENITEVNVTLPSGFVFIADSNSTDSAATTFTNTSIVLTWVNSSAVSLVGNGTLQFFWFNATSSVTPGNYNFTVTSSNSTGVFETQNLSITVNDTVVPSSVNFVSPSESNSANLSRSNIAVNVTATDLGTLSTIIIRLYNSSGVLVNSSSGSTSPVFINFTGLSDGAYSFNASANDTFGNINSTATRTLTLDTTYPLVDYGTGTAADNANVSVSHVYVNASVTEANEVNITFRLYNTTGVVNTTTYTDATRTINWTSLPDGVYTYNFTVVDVAGNINSTATRTLTLDTTYPLVDYGTGTAANNANVSVSNIYVNASVTETNEVNITFRLYNTTGVVNTTTYTDAGRTINWTGLVDAVYTYNVTVVDVVGNINSTATRTITLDTAGPLVDYGTGTAANNANVSVSHVYVNASVTETNEVNITFRLYNTTGVVNTTTYTDAGRTINWTGLVDAVYTYNVTVVDVVGNINSTATRTITLDTTSPSSITFVSPSANNSNVSTSNIFINVTAADSGTLSTIFIRLYNSSVVLINSSLGTSSPTSINFTNLTDGVYYYNATSNDTLGNANNSGRYTILLDSVDPVITFACSDSAVSIGGTVTCTCSATDASSGVSSITYTTNPSTSVAGTITTNCTAVDYAGNSVLAETTYIVAAASSGSSGSSGSYPTYSPSVTDLSTGYDISLGKGYKVNFNLAGQSHTLKVDSISGDKVTITVSSTPVTFDLVSGQTKKVDVDGNGVYDLDVYLKSVSAGRAEILLMSISESVPVASTGAVAGVDVVPAKEVPVVKTEEMDKGIITGNVVFDTIGGNRFIAGLIVVLVVLLIFVIIYWKNVKKQFLELKS